MNIIEKIQEKLGIKNPKRIADRIAESYKEKKENGEENPIDETVEEIMQMIGQNYDEQTTRQILTEIVEKLPPRIFEKTATKISESEELPDSLITDVVKNSETNISDESINRILEEGSIDVAERINLMQNVEDENIIEERVKNELAILYRVCKNKKDYEVVERVDELKRLLNGSEIGEDIQNLIRQVIAKKMAENYYSDTKKGTRIYDLSKIMPVEDMLEFDLPTMVEQEFQEIEEKHGDKKGRFDKKGLKGQILTEVGKNIAYRHDETGVFAIPQSEIMKEIDKDEEEEFIKTIQTYSRKPLSKEEIVDIDEQIRGNQNNIQIKENILINLIKKIPEKDKIRSIEILSKIASSNENELETISMLEKSGLVNKLNEVPEDKREETIKIIGESIGKRKIATQQINFGKGEENPQLDIFVEDIDNEKER